MKNVAVVLAGGVGRRLGLGIPKQFLKMAGKSILEHSIDAFDKHVLIDEIAVVVHPMFVSKVHEMVSKNQWGKVKKILTGGKERYSSSYSAVEAYSTEGEEVNLIFHDGVRPLISSRVITDVCDKLQSEMAVDVAIPAVDTIIKVDESGKYVSDIPDRTMLRSGQTPQGFRMSVIKKAYEKALQDPNFKATDDCGIVVKYLPEVKVAVVNGEGGNVKLTNPEDIYLLDKLFQIKATSPFKRDFKDLLGKVMVIFGGNSGIGKDMAIIAKTHGAKVHVFSRTVGAVDVSCYKNVERALKNVYSKEGAIHFVVNSAAILNKEPILHITKKIMDDVVDVNFKGAVNTTIASFPYLKQTGGHILQFTSSSYTRGRAYYALYSSTKSGVVNFVQAISEEWADSGIKINCVNPQRTKTPMRVKNFGLEDDSTLLKSEEVAKVAIWTMLNEMTGQVVDVKLDQSLK